MKIWDRLDEVIGSGMIAIIVIVAMLIGYDSSVSQMGVTGIVALLAVNGVRSKIKGEEDG